MTKFSDLGLGPKNLAALEALNFSEPTPIQKQAIPVVLSGRDLIGLAQTGTGKTAAFGLPLIEHLLRDEAQREPKAVRALILAPTRELVTQIATNLKALVRQTKLKVNIVVGGASINRQTEVLARGTDILVATPGRLIDLTERRALNLTATRYLVLDEADQMLDLGFIHDLRKIVRLVPKKRQTMLFSATMPKAIADLAADYLTDPAKVEVNPPGKAADKVEQFVHFVAGRDQKAQILRDTLKENPDGRSIVFLRTKHSAEKLSKHLINIGFAAASIHGNKSQGQRERALKAFKDGEARVLVATDVAARGIDIPGVTHVYNYDLPTVPDAYVHRIGRTARAGRDGIAIAFCAPDDIKLLRDIEKLTGIALTVASGEPPANERPAKSAQPARRRGRGGQQAKSEGGERAPGQQRPARNKNKRRANAGGNNNTNRRRPNRNAERRQSGAN
ncbi:DEAD/DEAH box helicase [Rhizobium sp. L1K21]|uniref:DEAD/DEAH box helicase n=1 Tax=Rhizobium sp. L1K21 TaxID=2954933 RepID=UPI00209366DE|nr:DEAD/DEAH box helicase [Rhizobium sp. L1K21]MCO6185374.1 DEAD/DEAH box helicase [Rhizobium sp. L1K21]